MPSRRCPPSGGSSLSPPTSPPSTAGPSCREEQVKPPQPARPAGVSVAVHEAQRIAALQQRLQAAQELRPGSSSIPEERLLGVEPVVSQSQPHHRPRGNVAGIDVGELKPDPCRGRVCFGGAERVRQQMGRLVLQQRAIPAQGTVQRSEEHTSELQSRENLVCRLLLE